MCKTTVTAFVQPNVQTWEKGLRTNPCLPTNIDCGIAVELSDLDLIFVERMTRYGKFRSYQ
jgi:hypothetical protein